MRPIAKPLPMLIQFILLIFTISCKPASKEILQYYTSGEVSRKHTEINGKKEGQMTEYYKDGSRMGERLFVNDEQVGKTIYYYPGGQLKEVVYFVHGKMNGGDTIFYDNGQTQFLRNWKDGKLDGYIRKWDVDGKVVYEAKYANDELVEVKGQSINPDTLKMH